MTDDEKATKVGTRFETVTEYEVNDTYATDYERTLGAKLAEMIDGAFKDGAEVEDVIGAVGQVLHSLVTFDNHAKEGKVVSVLVEPFECGCLCIQAREVTPRHNFDDDGNIESGCKPN